MLVKYWNANNNYPYASYSLENYILDQYFYPNTSLKYLFYQFWSGFNYTYDTSQWIKDKVDLAKKRTANAKSYDEQDMPASALSEIKKVIPSL